MSSNACAFLCGMACGAGLMYLMDPLGGRRRRAQLEETASSWANQAEDYVEKTARNVGNRAGDLVQEARRAVGISR